MDQQRATCYGHDIQRNGDVFIFDRAKPLDHWSTRVVSCERELRWGLGGRYDRRQNSTRH
jgi:hypothetical protein